MNKQNLVMTPTGDMNREQWLQFRNPVNHVKIFLNDWFVMAPGSDEIEGGYSFPLNNVDLLKKVFQTPEWLAYIFPCIGASEISSIVGLNPYKSVIELFYEKVGLKETFNEDNAAMFWGRTLESTIADKWQFWEGSQESVIQNSNSGKVVRKCRRVNFYTQNKNTPWIYVSLDRIINKYGGREEGSLECKTISGYAADMWQDKIPPMYVVQLQTQLLTYEFKYGEMAILKDGRGFEVYEFDIHPDICERLKTESKKFFDLVKLGIENYLLYKASGDAQYLAKIDSFSPEPDGSTAYETYLKETYNKDGGYEKLGGVVEVHLAKGYKYFDGQIKESEAKKRECANKLRDFMRDAAVIDLGNEGKVSWKADKNGNRTLRVKINVEDDFKPDPEIIKSEPVEDRVVSMDFNNPESISTLPVDFQ